MTTQEPLGWKTLVIHPNGRTESHFESWMSGRPYGPQDRGWGGAGASDVVQVIKNDERTGERSLLCYYRDRPSAVEHNHVASMMMDTMIRGLALVIWEVME